MCIYSPFRKMSINVNIKICNIILVMIEYSNLFICIFSILFDKHYVTRIFCDDYMSQLLRFWYLYIPYSCVVEVAKC